LIAVITHAGQPRSVGRIVVVYGLLSLIPVALLGAALAVSYNREAQRRGVAEGRSEALLVAQTGVEPLLDGRLLSAGLSPAESAALRRLVVRAVGDRHVLRLRLRDLTGKVVYSDDGSGFDKPPEDEVFRAVRGETVAFVTRVNTDGNDTGPAGVSSVEVYLPLLAGAAGTHVGVLEMYLPYAPISSDVAAGIGLLYRNMTLGLSLLWLLLLGTSWSMSRGLRRQVSINAFQAEHDSLTGLPNRVLFHRRAAAAVQDSSHTARGTVVAIVDLDRFKDVNDTLGHYNGDRLLAELSRRLADHTRAGDTVARLGGDEFGVILHDCTDPQAALGEIRSLIMNQVEVHGLPLAVEASIGFVVAPEDGDEVDVLLQRADVAMYVAKEKHSGVVRYDPSQNHYDATNLTLVAELRHAIDDNQLVLHYQPKTTLVDGRVDAVEALVRWQHPKLGLLPPDRFLPLAEQTELIDKLTRWVLGRAAVDMQALDPAAAGISVAVNVSARNLAHADFAYQVASIIAAAGLPAARLIVEITETALLVDPPRAARVLTELTALGVRVSLDDFGSGQTSLGYLSALPVHELKIDKSFVEDMVVNAGHAAIVRSIVELGHNMSMHVVGEGVETADVLAGLRDTGCDVAQGFLFARPMPLLQLGPWLAARQSERRGGRDQIGQLTGSVSQP
jgi:diguanylate cyclase